MSVDLATVKRVARLARIAVSEEEAKIDEKEELKKQMDEAVAAQNFELAAQLRDRIKELEGGNENE